MTAPSSARVGFLCLKEKVKQRGQTHPRAERGRAAQGAPRFVVSPPSHRGAGLQRRRRALGRTDRPLREKHRRRFAGQREGWAAAGCPLRIATSLLNDGTARTTIALASYGSPAKQRAATRGRPSRFVA